MNSARKAAFVKLVTNDDDDDEYETMRGVVGVCVMIGVDRDIRKWRGKGIGRKERKLTRQGSFV